MKLKKAAGLLKRALWVLEAELKGLPEGVTRDVVEMAIRRTRQSIEALNAEAAELARCGEVEDEDRLFPVIPANLW